MSDDTGSPTAAETAAADSMRAGVPLDDLVCHEHEDCVCGPARVPVVAGDGARSVITIHRRLDGRDHVRSGYADHDPTSGTLPG